MFITAEYRRGMIRTTLAASPRRGRVLAAKAIVIGAVTFVAGLVAAAVTIPLGERLLHAQRQPDLPGRRRSPSCRSWSAPPALLAVAAVLGAGRRHDAAPQRRGGHRRDRRRSCCRTCSRSLPAPAGRRRGVAAPRHPGRRVRRPAEPHRSTRRSPTVYTPATATSRWRRGPASRCCAPGRPLALGLAAVPAAPEGRMTTPCPGGHGFWPSRAGVPVSQPTAPERTRNVSCQLRRHRPGSPGLRQDLPQGCSSRR